MSGRKIVEAGWKGASSGELRLQGNSTTCNHEDTREGSTSCHAAGSPSFASLYNN